MGITVQFINGMWVTTTLDELYRLAGAPWPFVADERDDAPAVNE